MVDKTFYILSSPTSRDLRLDKNPDPSSLDYARDDALRMTHRDRRRIKTANKITLSFVLTSRSFDFDQDDATGQAPETKSQDRKRITNFLFRFVTTK